MITGTPLFRGRDNNDQLLHIMRLLGTPTEAEFQKIAKESVSLAPCDPFELDDLNHRMTARNTTQAVSHL